MTQGVNFFGKIGKLATARILSFKFLVLSWGMRKITLRFGKLGPELI
jgi:hypothetical protein